MTDQLSPLAVQNAPLLRALQDGAAIGPTDLAARAGIHPNHVHRKLDALEGEGLIVRTPDGPKHAASLTAAAEKTLLAVDVFDGKLIAGGEPDVTMIPLMWIDRSPLNPRRHFSEVTVMEMAQSIADKGILQPLVVRRVKAEGNLFHVIIGERRWRGANLAVKERCLPSDFQVPCRIREYTDEEALEVAGVENLQREDLHWMDEAQFYLSLKRAGRTASQVERLVGGTRGKRSIQDYTKIAEELSEADVSRTYLDPKHADYLPYVRARDMVGDKKEKPALELSPKLKLAFLELIFAAVNFVPPRLGETIQARLHKPPVGGPLTSLASDRKLVEFGFDNRLDGRPVVARIKITPDVAKYLEQVGFIGMPGGTLVDARAAIVGEMHARGMLADEFVTPELNAPKTTAPDLALLDPSPATTPVTEPPPFSAPPPGGDDDDDDDEEEDQDPIFNRADEVGEAFAGREGQRPDHAEPGTSLGGMTHPESATALPLMRADEPAPLPAMLQIVLVELGHRIGAQGIERGPGTWATEVLAAYYKDTRGMQLVQAHRMLAFLPMGHKTMATVTKRGLDWLKNHAGFQVSDAGRPSFSDGELLEVQRELGFSPEQGAYSTFWLNDPAAETGPAETVEPVAAPAPAAAPPAPQDTRPGRDEFARQILAVTAEARAIGRMAGALREARSAIGIARSMKLTSAQVTKLQALIDSALDAAQPHLNEDLSNV